ncbi:hypothetical protein HOY80DRAFT_997568 [Tuber brumale]|nr:hypothetical protein HOY80DRAFT_997568 [Tuber brumale]
MPRHATLGVLLTRAGDLCNKLREGYRDWSQLNYYPLENLLLQLEGIENELAFMTRCFNDIETGECVEPDAKEHIILGIGRLMRDLEDLHANMGNENHSPVKTVYGPLGSAKGISGVAYRAIDFYVSTKWRAIEVVQRSRRSLQVRYENMTRSQGISMPASRKGLIKSKLTFSALSRERERYLGSSHSLPNLRDRRGGDENPKGLRQRANAAMSDLFEGQSIYDRAWEDMGRRIGLARQRITRSSKKALAEKPEENGEEESVEPS